MNILLNAVKHTAADRRKLLTGSVDTVKNTSILLHLLNLVANPHVWLSELLKEREIDSRVPGPRAESVGF